MMAAAEKAESFFYTATAAAAEIEYSDGYLDTDKTPKCHFSKWCKHTVARAE